MMTFSKLPNLTLILSLSAKHYREEVFDFIMWNVILPTGVEISIVLINEVSLISNLMLTSPTHLVSSSMLCRCFNASNYL